MVGFLWGMVGISEEIQNNWGILPQLNGLNLRFFVCGTRPERPSRMDYPHTRAHTAGTGISSFVAFSNYIFFPYYFDSNYGSAMYGFS